MGTSPSSALTNKVYLDEQGNPQKVYLDDNGNPLSTLSKAQTIKAPPKMFSKQWWKEKALRFAMGTAESLPAAGATVGAYLGGVSAGPPGAVGGAGLLGMGGEAGKQLMERALGYPDVPQTPEEAAKRITKEGLVQGGLQLAAEPLAFLSKPLRSSATSQYERALAPTKQTTKAIAKKITPGLIERGEFGSLEGLSERATQNVERIKSELDLAYGRVPVTATKGASKQIIADLDKLQNRYIVEGRAVNPTAVNAISNVRGVVMQYGDNISPMSLRQMKRIFDEPVAARGGYAGADLATRYTLKAQKAAANSIREILSRASPDVAALNKEISFWLDVQKVVSETAKRRTGQAGGLLRVLSPLAGSAGLGFGIATHSAQQGVEAGAAATLAALAYDGVRSPAWRTASAVLKNRFAGAIARGDVRQAFAVAARLGVATPGVMRSQRQSAPQMQQ